MKTWLLSVILFCFALTVKSQQTQTFFLDNDFKVVDDSVASNMGVAMFVNNKWEMLIYGIGHGKKIMHGFYDSEFKKLLGPITHYYPEGTLKAKGYFDPQGRKAGWWKNWSEIGKITDSIFYVNGEEKETHSFSYFLVNKLEIHEWTIASKKERGKKEYYANGNLRHEYLFIGQNGYSKDYYTTGLLSREHIFSNNGKNQETNTYDVHGNPMNTGFAEKQTTESSPEFPGGRNAMETFMRRSIRLPEESDGDQRFSQSVTVSFNLNESGRAYDIKFTEGTDSFLANQFRLALERMPAWDMKGNKSYGPIKYTLNLQ